MYQHVSFFVQLLFYSVIMYTASLKMSEDDIRIRGLHVRTVVSVFQVAVLMLLWLCKVIFMFFITLLKRDKQQFVLVDIVTHHRTTDATTPNATTETSNDDRGLDPAGLNTEVQNVESQNVEAAEGSDNESKCTAATTARQHDTHSVPGVDSFSLRSESTVSIGTDLRSSIVFDNSDRLDAYLLYLLAVGGIMWNTFLSFNFATVNTSTAFVTGLVTGFMTINIWHYRNKPRSCSGICWMSVYATLYIGIISMSWEQLASVDDVDSFMRNSMYVAAFISGMFWTCIAGEVAFQGHSQLHRHGIYYDARRALPIFLLIMCINGLCVAPDTRIAVWDYMSNLSRLATLHLLCIEPVLKFLSMYIMIITLERKRTIDFVTTILVVQAAHVVLQTAYAEYNAVIITLIVVNAMLLGVHVTFVIRHTTITK